MTWKAYAILPIDFGWEFLPTVERVAGQLASSVAELAVTGITQGSQEVDNFLADFNRARQLAKAAGWEGDYRAGSTPRVFWLPDEGSFQYAFVWKHDNNGDTFVVSPRPLAWLDDVN